MNWALFVLMEIVVWKWGFLFLLCLALRFSFGFSVEGLNGNSRVRGVNLGGWLVIEGWIKPSLFDDIPNNDMLDGTEVQIKSVSTNKYVSADNGGGGAVAVDRDIPLAWETFRLWRVSESVFQFRTFGRQFLSCNGNGGNVSAEAELPSDAETFYLERNIDNRIHIKCNTATFLQVSNTNQLTADYVGTPGWDDNAATFKLIIVSNNLHGDYQLANGYGHEKAQQVYKNHRDTFIRVEDFDFLYKHGINTVRIPVGWWIAYDPIPPPPYIGGSLQALDDAFSWAQEFNIKCIIDVHAAPGSQNGMEHSSSRDGTTGWPTSSDYVKQTLDVIDFLASRYTKHPLLLGIELLNEPSAAFVPMDTLASYYKQGYQIVRKHSSTAYVIFCQRIGNADPFELVQANLGDTNTVIDVHYYNLFDSFFSNMSSVDNIQYIYDNRLKQIQALNSANGPLVYIGEWVAEWDVVNGSRSDYQDFGRAQLEVYNGASFGWTYWTLKNDLKHWDFEWVVGNDYLQLQLGSSSLWRASAYLMLLGFACGSFL